MHETCRSRNEYPERSTHRTSDEMNGDDSGETILSFVHKHPEDQRHQGHAHCGFNHVSSPVYVDTTTGETCRQLAMA